MPVELIWRDRGVIYRCTGILSGAEIIAGNKSAYEDPRWRKAHFQLVDLRDLEKADVSAADLETAADLEKTGSDLNPDARLVVVKPTRADASVTKLVTDWFMQIHNQVTFSVRFTETMEDAEKLL